MFIGQSRLKSQIEKMNKLPRFLLIVGSRGSGKRTLTDWIMHYTSVTHEIVEDHKIDSARSVIEVSLTLSKPRVFIFYDVQNMNIQAQNAFLKNLEEPAENAHFVMTVNSSWNVLGTIRSRASILTMDGYSKEDLRHFTDDEKLLKMCITPGQIKRYQEFDWEALLDHCEKVVDNVGRINVGNIFNILRHVKEDHYDLFIPTLQYVYADRVRGGDTVIRQLKILQDTSILLERSISINARNALETMLLKLWEVS